MPKFLDLVVKCRENLKRRRLSPGTVQMIVLTKSDEEAIAQLEYTISVFCCRIGSLLGTKAQSTSGQADESVRKE